MQQYCVYSDKRQMLQELTQSLRLHSKGKHVLWELIACISTAVGADGFRLYLCDTQPDISLSLYVGTDKNGMPIIEKMERNTAPIAYYVAETKQPVRLSKDEHDPRFPDGVPTKVIYLLHFSHSTPFWIYVVSAQCLNYPMGYSQFFFGSE